jgi:hypothetical protein
MARNSYWETNTRRGLRIAGFDDTDIELIRQLFPMFHPFGFKEFLHLPNPAPVLAYERELTAAGVRFDNDDLREDFGHAYWPLERITKELGDIVGADGKEYATGLWRRLERQRGFVMEYPPGNKTYALDDMRIESNRMNWENIKPKT